MEVGPLNNIRPPVEGPTEGQTGRAEKVTSKENRLVSSTAKASRATGDSISIKSNDNRLTESQEKSGIGSVATEAILRLINSINDLETGQGDADKVKQALDDVNSLKFNGKAVFNGEQMTYKAEDGTSAKVTLPEAAKVEQTVLADLKSFTRTKKTNSKSLQELNKLHSGLSNFVRKVKTGIKSSVGLNNKEASRTAIRQIKDLEQFLQDVKEGKAGRAPVFKDTQGMSSKVVKLLK